MRKNKKNPYGVDVDKELKVFNHVGLNYGKSERVRKKKKYQVYDTYLEWKEHAKMLIPQGNTNYNNYLHWLYRKLNNAEYGLDMIKTFIIPLCISTLPLSEIFMASENRFFQFFTIVLMIIIVEIFALSQTHNVMREKEFFENLIKVTEGEKNKYIEPSTPPVHF